MQQVAKQKKHKKKKEIEYSEVEKVDIDKVINQNSKQKHIRRIKTRRCSIRIFNRIYTIR